jgi:hypothetical protein
MAMAWHMAALSRAKRLPRLKSLLAGEQSAKPRQQSTDEMIAIARQWTSVLNRSRNNR